MKSRISKDNPNENREKINSSEPIKNNKMKKNVMRLGGGGLSLEAFANAKTKSKHYNPALIKKQREFYKNAKYVGKYKKSIKHQSEQSDPSWAIRLLELQDENETREDGKMNQKNKKNKYGACSVREVYEKQRNEEEKARIEKEAIIQAKNEGIERSKSRRKALKEKMLKKTRSGQPVMKYRIEHLLQTIQGSTS